MEENLDGNCGTFQVYQTTEQTIQYSTTVSHDRSTVTLLN